ncbi:Hint domain-containing protein [Swaminathania salitolerans]|uniref:Hedgehog/Intein (Hint) domain-containing protein n=1 Tax=Swaminathania salitolerans TaxID=182838 RepID=A0A511BQQ4_9PROT|nr:Hint domain-containing protein [Swaminathania salitolerans]GBQ15017.1 outer membrane protein [Swaminathania salitolerans LMG 21291]GEL01964.1 hypothetical protein SSA02_11270 [Swaminathania salitolerans]
MTDFPTSGTYTLKFAYSTDAGGATIYKERIDGVLNQVEEWRNVAFRTAEVTIRPTGDGRLYIDIPMESGQTVTIKVQPGANNRSWSTDGSEAIMFWQQEAGQTAYWWFVNPSVDTTNYTFNISQDLKSYKISAKVTGNDGSVEHLINGNDSFDYSYTPTDYLVQVYNASGVFVSGADTLSGALTSGQTAVIHSGGVFENGALQHAVISGQPGGEIGGSVSVDGSSIIVGGAIVQSAVVSMAGGAELSGTITNRGAISGGTLLGAGGTEIVYDGGSISDQFSYGIRVVSSGGTILNGAVQSGATDTILAGGETSNGALYAGALRVVSSGGIANTPSIATGATVDVMSGGTLNGATNIGMISAQSGAMLTGEISNTGTISALSGVTISGIVRNGGTITTGDHVPIFGTIYNSGYISGTNIIAPGATEIIYAGGVAQDQSNEGTRIVSSGGVIRNGVVASGSLDTVLSGGSTVQGVLYGGATRVASSGGTIINPTNVGATVAIMSGGSLVGAINTSGTINAESGAILEGTITNGGTISGGTLTGSGSTETVSAGGIIEDQVSYADRTASSGGTIRNGVIGEGGTDTIRSGGVAGGVTVVQAAGRLILDAGAVVTGSVDLQGRTGMPAVLTISDVPLPGFRITGFGAGDVIDLAGIKRADVVEVSFIDEGNTVVFRMKDGSTESLNLAGAQAAGYKLTDGSDGTLVYQTCFLAGTLIETSAGPVTVETIRPGTLVRVYGCEDEYRAVIWTGFNHINVNRDLPVAEAGYPVRICRDAIGPSTPDRDLLVTAEHCLYIDGVFIPARMLVNGQSIQYDTSIDSYSYYHLETERHSIISANNTLTESYLDTGNRSAFALDPQHPTTGNRHGCWSTDAAAPLDTRRETVEPIFRTLQARAAIFPGGVEPAQPLFDEDPDLMLQSDRGETFLPLRQNGKLVIFSLPVDCGTLTLKSRCFCPASDIGPFIDDRRTLGVRVGKITCFYAGMMVPYAQHLREDDLTGWEPPAANAESRWTRGAGALPAALTETGNPFILAIEILETGRYRIESAGLQTYRRQG